MATCYDCRSVPRPNNRRCSACEHWNPGITRRIISAVKEGSSSDNAGRGAPLEVADGRSSRTRITPLTNQDHDRGVHVDPSFVVEIGRRGNVVNEFNDFVVVI